MLIVCLLSLCERELSRKGRKEEEEGWISPGYGDCRMSMILDGDDK